MNRLRTADRAKVITSLVEGDSLRATGRHLRRRVQYRSQAAARDRHACSWYHDNHVRGLKARRVQADEIWSFVGAKQRNTTAADRAEGMGDVWTWVALDSDTRLCISYLVGGRDGGWGWDFMQDVAARIRGRVQLTTDGHKAYLEAVEGAFGLDVGFATLHKIYGAVLKEDRRRYSPARCIAAT